jgi:hypothetical protein|tara:strand:- start:4121 stop:4351 length:231 start_codon:yes stop_codon:yes gene_type:complete
MIKMLNKIMEFMTSDMVLGGSLIVVGAAVAIGAGIAMLSRPLPIIRVSAMQVAGALTLLLGVAVVTKGKVDPLDLE